jgi:hypothetical protein
LRFVFNTVPPPYCMHIPTADLHDRPRLFRLIPTSPTKQDNWARNHRLYLLEDAICLSKVETTLQHSDPFEWLSSSPAQTNREGGGGQGRFLENSVHTPCDLLDSLAACIFVSPPSRSDLLHACYLGR